MRGAAGTTGKAKRQGVCPRVPSADGGADRERGHGARECVGALRSDAASPARGRRCAGWAGVCTHLTDYIPPSRRCGSHTWPQSDARRRARASCSVPMQRISQRMLCMCSYPTSVQRCPRRTSTELQDRRRPRHAASYRCAAQPPCGRGGPRQAGLLQCLSPKASQRRRPPCLALGESPLAFGSLCMTCYTPTTLYGYSLETDLSQLSHVSSVVWSDESGVRL